MRTLKIGNAHGYWGDDPHALKRQVEKGHLDYISMDFLAEVTMSILRKQYLQNPEGGYAHDFIPMFEEVLPTLLKNKTRLITNAGGINPASCAKACEEVAKKLNLKPKIAVVYGDDILSRVPDLVKQGAAFTNMESQENFSSISQRMEAANVYFGAYPVVEALKKWQPDIIITGRVTDTGITLAPMIYEFGWSLTDWNKLAAGIIAGHMIECGSQVTGGNFSDWEKVKDYREIGYPIVEVSEDGSFVLTKHKNTGGYVSYNTVREQTFYEMGNPSAYITPDVVADFSTIHLKDIGENRVQVSGIKGYEPTPLYKVSMAYSDGFKSSGAILVSGPRARQKAEKFAEIFWNRCSKDSFTETMTDFLGWNACHKSLGHVDDGAEILLRLSVRGEDEKKIKQFSKLIPSLILGGPPGVAVLGGVPKVQTVVSFWPALMEKERIHPKIALYDHGIQSETELKGQLSGSFKESKNSTECTKATKSIQAALGDLNNPEATPLYSICLARSGDKGDSANIGVLARSDKAYEFIKNYLTAERVKNFFQEICLGKVVRFELSGLRGLNFLLEESLGGGGSCSLRVDPQGKTFSQALLRQKVLIPRDVLDSVHD